MSDTTPAPPATADPRAALERHFGFREFLSGQEEIVQALLEERDTLAVMPTGGGKSLCFQLPAMIKEGVTLVVSPLIALMKDQVDGLVEKGVPATMINSTLSLAEQNERLEKLAAGEFKLVYVAPERFRSGAFLAALRPVSISLFAVDEAHCLSQWGHDFRPDYLRLAEAVEILGHPQTAAFTATATPEVRSDILEVLKLRDPFVAVSGFERPNLSLRVTECSGNREKYERLEALVKRRKTGIVYCATRKKVEEVAESLSDLGVKLVAYHGGMVDEDRTWAQNVFLKREVDVAVATNAFGMGIDRSDVRFVAHFDVPGSIEAYYQEAGRAGRDGEGSECELLFNYADTRTQEFFIDGNNPGHGVIVELYECLRRFANEQNEVHLPIAEMASALGLKNNMQVSSALSHLSRTGHVDRFDVPGQRMRGTRLRRPELSGDQLEIDVAALEEKERRDRAKLENMIRFCYDHGTCRQAWILNYFGEADGANCGSCDICTAGQSGDRRPPSDEEFAIVRKALSGVARSSDRFPGGAWEGRFGKGKIVQMLTGKRSAELVKTRLDQLSTFGLLEEQGEAYVRALIGELEKNGYLVTKKSPYPLLTLTPRGAELMRGKRDYTLDWPDAAKLAVKKGQAGKNSSEDFGFIGSRIGERTGVREKVAKAATKVAAGSGDALDGIDGFEELAFEEELYERLSEIRRGLAEEEGKPAYVVFGNKVLEAFTRLKPVSREEAMRIHGVGEVKAERYLEPFLEAIREWKGEEVS